MSIVLTIPGYLPEANDPYDVHSFDGALQDDLHTPLDDSHHDDEEGMAQPNNFLVATEENSPARTSSGIPLGGSAGESTDDAGSVHSFGTSTKKRRRERRRSKAPLLSLTRISADDLIIIMTYLPHPWVIRMRLVSRLFRDICDADCAIWYAQLGYSRVLFTLASLLPRCHLAIRVRTFAGIDDDDDMPFAAGNHAIAQRGCMQGCCYARWRREILARKVGMFESLQRQQRRAIFASTVVWSVVPSKLVHYATFATFLFHGALIITFLALIRIGLAATAPHIAMILIWVALVILVVFLYQMTRKGASKLKALVWLSAFGVFGTIVLGYIFSFTLVEVLEGWQTRVLLLPLMLVTVVDATVIVVREMKFLRVVLRHLSHRSLNLDEVLPPGCFGLPKHATLSAMLTVAVAVLMAVTVVLAGFEGDSKYTVTSQNTTEEFIDPTSAFVDNSSDPSATAIGLHVSSTSVLPDDQPTPISPVLFSVAALMLAVKIIYASIMFFGRKEVCKRLKFTFIMFGHAVVCGLLSILGLFAALPVSLFRDSSVSGAKASHGISSWTAVFSSGQRLTILWSLSLSAIVVFYVVFLWNASCKKGDFYTDVIDKFAHFYIPKSEKKKKKENGRTRR